MVFLLRKCNHLGWSVNTHTLFCNWSYKTLRERDRQLESVEASSMAVVSTPLLWVQCLSGKSVQLVIGTSRVWFPAGALWSFLSLSPKLTASIEPHPKVLVVTNVDRKPRSQPLLPLPPSFFYCSDESWVCEWLWTRLGDRRVCVRCPQQPTVTGCVKAAV